MKKRFNSRMAVNIDCILDRFVDGGQLPVASAAVYQGGKEVYRHFKGVADISGKKVSVDTIFRIFSMTKVITTAALLKLYERGLVTMKDPVSEYIPSFRNQTVLTVESDGREKLSPAKTQNTIGNLLTMTSGIPYYHAGRTPCSTHMSRIWERMDADIAAGKGWSTFDAVSEIGKNPLEFNPGEKFQYGLGIDVIGGVIEVVSGKRLGDFFRAEIFEPLGMRDTDFYVPEEKMQRLCEFFTKGPDGSFVPANRFQDRRQLSRPTYEEGGDGIVTTISDYGRFAQMLLGGGSLNGERILGPKTVALMSSNHLNEAQLRNLDKMPVIKGYGYGLGVRVMMDPARTGLNGSRGEFGWYGHGGSWFCVDPEEDMVAVFMTQLTPSIHTETVPKFTTSVYAALG